MEQKKRALTREDLERVRIPPEVEIHSRVAMEKLPRKFAELGNCKDGREFVEHLVQLILPLRQGEPRYENESPDILTPHLIYGLSQLAHDMRNRLSGSRRSSFKPVIAQLLQIKNKMGERTGERLAELMFRVFHSEKR